MDYYKILGVTQNCDRATLRRTFRELSKTQHPDRFPEGKRAEAERQYQSIVIAFNVLKDDKQRALYDKKLSRPVSAKPQAQEDPATAMAAQAKAGMSLFRQGRYEESIGHFKKALHYRDDADIYFHKGLAERQVTRLHKDAINSLQRAIAIDVSQVQYYFQLIKTLRDFGLSTRAKVYLEKALERFPDHEGLLQLARELDPQKYKKNFLGNLFGR